MKRLFLLDDGKDFEAVLRIGLHKRGIILKFFFPKIKLNIKGIYLKGMIFMFYICLILLRKLLKS